LEPALFQFLIGVVGGCALGFALIRIRATASITGPVLFAFQPLQSTRGAEPVKEPAKSSESQQVSASTILAIAQSPAQPLGIPIELATKLELRQILLCHICPACGLQAPETLMKEHFLGSPLHENIVSPSAGVVLSGVSLKCASPVEDDTDSGSLGDLLQTLSVMESLLKRDFYRHELRVGSGIGGRMANIGGWVS